MGKSPFINSNRERVLDPLTAFRLQSMMRGVVERGTAKSVAIKGVEIAGKTGTTNDAKDVWFVGFTRNIVAGCYIGFDTPQPLRKGASGGGMWDQYLKSSWLKRLRNMAQEALANHQIHILLNLIEILGYCCQMVVQEEIQIISLDQM